MGTQTFLGMPPPNVVAWIEAKKAKTYVKYTAASGLSDWEGDIVGELTSGSIPNKSSIAEVVIGNHVTKLGDGCFQNCNNLIKVVIPDSVQIIGAAAFYSCSSLPSIVIPKSVYTFQDDSVFANDSNLRSVTFLERTKAEVQALPKYSWRIVSGCVIHCTDGNISI